jgi:hypothetical protein
MKKIIESLQAVLSQDGLHALFPSLTEKFDAICCMCINIMCLNNDQEACCCCCC